MPKILAKPKLRAAVILETMWDWRGMTSGAGYREAPSWFRINPDNFTGSRLYWLLGHNHFQVTNACRELVCSANQHGTPDPAWLAMNLRIREYGLLLVCGRVAQYAYLTCGYRPEARVLEIPHPAARLWTRNKLDQTRDLIQSGVH